MKFSIFTASTPDWSPADAPLSKLAHCWTRYPQLVVNMRVREKKPFAELDGVLQLVAQAEAEIRCF